MSQVDLDTTLTALQRGLESMSIDEALTIIDAWAQQLQDSTIRENLQQVRQAIAGDQPSASLSDILTDLGTNTAAASSEVGDDEVIATKIQDIGMLLSEVGKSLE